MINPWVDSPPLTSSRLVMGEAKPPVVDAFAHIVTVKSVGLRYWSKGTSMRDPPSNVSDPPVVAFAPSAGVTEPSIVPSKPLPLASVPSISKGHHATRTSPIGTCADRATTALGTRGSSLTISREAVKVPSPPWLSKVTSTLPVPPPAVREAGPVTLNFSASGPVML